MIRIVGNKKIKPIKLSEQNKAVLGLIGILIADHPEKVIELLMSHQVQLSKNPTAEELTEKIISKISTNHATFNKDLAKIMSEQITPDDAHDSFNLGALFGGGEKGDTPSQNKGGSALTGADPVSAIAGAVGSLASLFRSGADKKIAEKQARSQTLSSILAFKAQQQEQVHQKSVMATKAAQTKMILYVLGFGGLITLMVLAFKSKPTPVVKSTS